MSGRPMFSISVLTRRAAFLLGAGAAACATTGSRAAEEQIVTVHKDPSRGCCSGWVRHLQQAGFTVKTIETADLNPVKTRLGVPSDLAACHTAQIGGLRHRRPCSRRRAQTFSQRQAERSRACRSWHAGRLSRHGGRERGAVRGRDVWARRATHLHAICRRARTLIGGGVPFAVGSFIQSSGPLRYAIVDGIATAACTTIRRAGTLLPSQELLVIRRNHRTGEVSLDPVRWGLIQAGVGRQCSSVTA